MLTDTNPLEAVFGTKTGQKEDKATLDDLVTGAVLRPHVKDVGFKPPLLIMDDYRRKWGDVKFSAALPIGEHAIQKTKDLSIKVFDDGMLTKETIVRPSYFGLVENEYDETTSEKVNVETANMILDDYTEKDSKIIDDEIKLVQNVANDDRVITLLANNPQKTQYKEPKAYPNIIIISEEDSLIEEYEKASTLYVRDDVQSGLEIETLNGKLYHDKVPAYQNDPDEYRILKSDEKKFKGHPSKY